MSLKLGERQGAAGSRGQKKRHDLGTPGHAGWEKSGTGVLDSRGLPSPSRYWIGETVAATANGSAGAAPDVSCQMVPCALVANARVPVEPTASGTPDA